MSKRTVQAVVVTVLAAALAAPSLPSSAANMPSHAVLPGSGHEVTVPQVERALQDLGYANIGRIQKDGRIFETTATWRDERLDLRINGGSGQITDASALTASPSVPSPVRLALGGHQTTIHEMRDALSRLGYANVRNVSHDGTIFTARAEWNGRDMDLRIDSDVGQVLQAGRARLPASDLGSPITLVGGAHQVTTHQVVQALGRVGYRDVRDVRKDGQILSARADWKGRDLSIRIDARSGRVTEL